MNDPGVIFMVGFFVTALCAGFLGAVILEFRRLGEVADREQGSGARDGGAGGRGREDGTGE